MVAPTDHDRPATAGTVTGTISTREADAEEKGTDMCRRQASTVIDAFAEFLLGDDAFAQTVDRAALLHLTGLFKDDVARKQDLLFRDQFEACQVLRDQEVWDRVRKDPFKRLLTHRLSRLFPPEHGFDAALSGTFVSRRVLSGLFLAFEKMTGSPAFQDVQTRCREILQDLFGDSGPINWQVFYDNSEANRAVDDFLVGIVPHFDDFAKRTAWLRDLINFDLAPFSLYAFEGEGAYDWILNTEGTVDILRALFRRLRQRRASTDGEREAPTRHGAARNETLAAFFRALDAFAPAAPRS